MDLSRYTRDTQTADLVDSKNYKQLLTNINRNLKRTPNDQYLLAFKAALLLKNGEFYESRSFLNLVLTQNDNFPDQDARQLLYDVACSLGVIGEPIGNAELDKLWQNTIKKQKTEVNKQSLTEEWALRALRNRNFPHMNKATQLIQQSFPKDDVRVRSYYFWQILAHWMVVMFSKNLEQSAKNLSLQLAMRMLDKAVDQTPEDLDSSKRPIICVQKQGELGLLVCVFDQFGLQERLASLLGESKFSRLVSDNYQLTRSQILALERDNNWKGLWNVTKHYLEVAIKRGHGHPLNDWKTWACLISCAEKMNNDSAMTETQLVIHKAMELDNSLLSPKKAQILFWFDNPDNCPTLVPSIDVPGSNALRSPARQAAECIFAEHHRPGAIEKLLQVVAGFSGSEFVQFQYELEEHAKELHRQYQLDNRKKNAIKYAEAYTTVLYIRRVNLHQKFEGVTERDSSTNEVAFKAYEDFTYSCADFYIWADENLSRGPPKENALQDRAANWATFGLHQLETFTGDQRYIVQALVFLDHVLQTARYNFDVRLAQIALLPLFPVPLLVWDNYKKLEVKDILYESMCPLMFKEIGIRHPIPTTNFKPYDEMGKCLNFYENALSKIPHFEEMSLEWQNYDSVVYMELLREELLGSKTRKMLVLERRRIARLNGWPYAGHDLTFEPGQTSGNLHENRPPGYVNVDIKDFGMRLPWKHIDLLSQLDAGFDLAYSTRTRSKEEIQELKDVHGVAFSREDVTPQEMAAVRLARNVRELAIDLHHEDEPVSEIMQRITRVREELKYVMESQAFEKGLANAGTSPFPLDHMVSEVFLELECLQASHRIAEKALLYLKARAKRDKREAAGAAAKTANLLAKGIQSSTVDRAKKLKKVAYDWGALLVKEARDENFSSRMTTTRGGEGREGVGERLERWLGPAKIKSVVVNKLLADMSQVLKQITEIKVGGV